MLHLLIFLAIVALSIWIYRQWGELRAYWALKRELKRELAQQSKMAKPIPEPSPLQDANLKWLHERDAAQRQREERQAAERVRRAKLYCPECGWHGDHGIDQEGMTCPHCGSPLRASDEREAAERVRQAKFWCRQCAWHGDYGIDRGVDRRACCPLCGSGLCARTEHPAYFGAQCATPDAGGT